jgi:hypothetical protein
VGKKVKALAAISFICCSVFALTYFAPGLEGSPQADQLTTQTTPSTLQLDASHILTIAGLGMVLIIVSLAIRQHQSPQGLNEKS